MKLGTITVLSRHQVNFVLYVGSSLQRAVKRTTPRYPGDTFPLRIIKFAFEDDVSLDFLDIRLVAPLGIVSVSSVNPLMAALYGD